MLLSYCLTGVIEEVLFEGRLVPKQKQTKFEQHSQFINGLQDYELQFKQNLKVILRRIAYLWIEQIKND